MRTCDFDKGFGFIPGNYYLNDQMDFDVIEKFKTSFQEDLASDGVRNRAYLKLDWERLTNQVTVSANQNYFQSAESNVDDGGKIRQFAKIKSSILSLPIMQSLLEKNIKIISTYEPLIKYDKLTFGIHFIQYHVCEMGASYSSPVGLHVDDEPLVFVHLIELTHNAIGGENLVAKLDNQEITNVIRLKNTLDTLYLTRSVYHAVTPLGSLKDTARRDVILFTVEPDATQK